MNVDRAQGALLGTAIGDALGLPFEGLSADDVLRRARRRPLDGYSLLGGTGFVSDDTQLTALLAHALLSGRGDLERSRRRFRRALAGWFLRLPWGIGFAT